METIFRNPEYTPFLTESDKNKFRNVQKALSIKDGVIDSTCFICFILKSGVRLTDGRYLCTHICGPNDDR